MPGWKTWDITAASTDEDRREWGLKEALAPLLQCTGHHIGNSILWNKHYTASVHGIVYFLPGIIHYSLQWAHGKTMMGSKFADDSKLEGVMNITEDKGH